MGGGLATGELIAGFEGLTGELRGGVCGDVWMVMSDNLGL